MALSLAVFVVAGAAGCYRASPVPSQALAAQAVAKAQQSRAERPPATGGSLSLQDAIEAARQVDPSIEALRHAIAAAQAGEGAAGAWDNPEIRLQTLSFDEYVRGESGLRLAYRTAIPVPGVLAANEAIAQAGTRAERARLLQLEQSIEAEVTRLYFEVALAALELRAAEGELQAVGRWVEATRLELEAMRAERLDAAKASLELTAAEVAVQVARAYHQAALESLAARLGRQDLVSHALSSPLPHPSQALETMPPWAGAQEMDAAVELAAAAIDAAAALSYIEESRRWPWFRFVQVSYSFDSSRPAGQTWAAVMALEVPLYTQNASGIARADALVKSAELQLAAAALRTQWRNDQLTAALRGAAEALLAAEAALEPAAVAATLEARATQEAGGARAVDRWDLEVRAARTETQRVRAHRRYVETWLRGLESRGQ
jgi:outer membrane protein TolC